MKRAIWIIVIIVLLGVAGWFLFQRAQDNRAAQLLESYQTVTAEHGSLVASIGATGQVHANQTALLNWQTTGKVEDVKVKVGDQVVADQVLAELAQTSLPQNVILAKAELINAQQTLEDLYTNAENAKSDALSRVAQAADQVRDAQYNLDNLSVPSNQKDMEPIEAYDVMRERLADARRAFEPYKYAPEADEARERLKEELDRAQSDFDTAVRRLQAVLGLEVAEANLENATKDYQTYQQGPDPEDIRAAEARVAAAQATLNLAHLAAPFNGTLTEVSLKPGDQVSPNVPSFRLDDLSRLLVDVRVPEVDINQITLGQEVELTFDAISDKRYQGIVSQVAEVGTSTQGVVEYIVTVELQDPDQNVRPGMTAAVNFVVTQLDDVLQVPNRAVRLREGNRVVYILVDGKPVPVDIELGASSETMSEVRSGDLKEGDLIILNPPAEFEGGGPPF
ncbi:MAG: secretion protein HlyD family protein [Chloroflexi bacterium]|jgi:HlyD family secretion protein|nr:secretion protein HlyD family protein [Chloroflexota bacterium]